MVHFCTVPSVPKSTQRWAARTGSAEKNKKVQTQGSNQKQAHRISVRHRVKSGKFLKASHRNQPNQRYGTGHLTETETRAAMETLAK